AFLKFNAEQEGVVVLPSGLQYKVITEGTGKKPSATDQVKCHYVRRERPGDSAMRLFPGTVPQSAERQRHGWHRGHREHNSRKPARQLRADEKERTENRGRTQTENQAVDLRNARTELGRTGGGALPPYRADAVRRVH
ncbi:MAG: hypothetical protein IKC96_02010, partial [Paludibacteraceae bacterium]|nr:hypothetical protein [Paludibacteraceae bacterium]